MYYHTHRILRVLRELRALLTLALPIMVAQLSFAGMGMVDTVMAGQLSAHDLAFVALGNSIWLPVYLLITGILLATTPKVALYYGAQQFSEIPKIVHQALWLALCVGAMATLLLWSAEPLLHLMSVEESLIAPTMQYLHAIGCAFPVVALSHVLRCYSDGIGLTKPIMILGFLGLLLNIPLNYVFIYGKFDVPAMGGVGCGWATALVMLFIFLGMLIWVARSSGYTQTRLFKSIARPERPPLGSLLRLGLPIGVAIFAESSIFSVIALLIGAMGAIVVAGHQISLNFSALIFMIPYSLGLAITVRVGHTLGAGMPREARFVAGAGMGAALLYACLSSSLMLLLREPIARLYTSDPAVMIIASSLLIYAAIFQLSDGVQATATGALRGYHDTRMTMLITLVAYWAIGLPIGYCLAFSSMCRVENGAAGLWQGLIIGLTVAAILLSVRLVILARRHIRNS